ncbi:NUDIX hydrolase [Rhizobium lentis]|uniref:8-oxo-dGTP diphosphatase n=1 Tax=Rhizobium lentis TaxID=1138194 RepID=A0ABS7IC03_9HYPH|nr:NUDIX domain-containing protein [Rhizobium lentis]MBX4957227.1 NUDIX domain-containing protein [Rhizobium lentis]MBX4975197.1 NUDIX domain-containing protein [Rhizobium lentis]MBX4987217.1 NUDIX domain-containing protein [Rhizobium lentis]MBX5005661.1 NUDIX domain-containing protein [Rhizobium lentis]MBX5027157.1 NUDIX domain-containing protein [Rhizobium lentis]
MPEIAMGALSRNGMLLLARRNSERRIYPDRWSLPGGHIEDGEDAETAMCRELLEEISVTPKRWQLAAKFVSQAPPEASATFHVYHVDQWQGLPQLVGDEHTELRWFTAAEVEQETELAPSQLGEILARLAMRGSGED